MGKGQEDETKQKRYRGSFYLPKTDKTRHDKGRGSCQGVVYRPRVIYTRQLTYIGTHRTLLSGFVGPRPPLKKSQNTKEIF